MLIVAMRSVEYRSLVASHSVEIDTGLVPVLCRGVDGKVSAIVPGLWRKYAAYMVDDKRASGASQAELDEVAKQGQDMKRMLDDPLINAAVTFTEPFPVGLLVTLISAAVLRKQEAA